VKPTAVLIEGLSDANSQIEYFTAPGTKPPFAVLAYTEELPIKTLLYPMAEYSPEYTRHWYGQTITVFLQSYRFAI
jgi:hypothetical protein